MMKKTYTLELTISLDMADESRLIQVARGAYNESGQAENEQGIPIPAEEAVSDAKSAILELAQGNGWFEEAGVEVIGFSCGEAAMDEVAREANTPFSPQQAAGDVDDAGYEPELDDCETGTYLYRWPNGDFSLVMSQSRREALKNLDEWGVAAAEVLVPMDSCMVDLRLSDDGSIELQQFGENTLDLIWDAAFPVLSKARDNAPETADGQYTSEGKEMIAKAVVQERTRLWDDQPEGPEAKTCAGRRLQKQANLAGPVADRYIRQAAKKLLVSDLPDPKKPN